MHNVSYLPYYPVCVLFCTTILTHLAIFKLLFILVTVTFYTDLKSSRLEVL